MAASLSGSWTCALLYPVRFSDNWPPQRTLAFALWARIPLGFLVASVTYDPVAFISSLTIKTFAKLRHTRVLRGVLSLHWGAGDPRAGEAVFPAAPQALQVECRGP